MSHFKKTTESNGEINHLKVQNELGDVIEISEDGKKIFLTQNDIKSTFGLIYAPAAGETYVHIPKTKEADALIPLLTEGLETIGYREPQFVYSPKPITSN